MSNDTRDAFSGAGVRTRLRSALANLIRVSEEAGLYDKPSPPKPDVGTQAQPEET